MRVETLERRALLAATPIGITPIDNAEFLLGNVVVTPVLFESDGRIDRESQDWDIEGGEIDRLLENITTGVNWWSITLQQMQPSPPKHTLNFTVDDTYAQDPFETPYEPIDGSSEVFRLWVGDFLQSNGYGVGQSMGVFENLERAVREFNHDQRIKHNADWAFTIFVVDSSDDLFGLFKAGRLRGAYAFPGGLFIVTPSTRPPSTIAHELGHIFWARDEYATSIPLDATRGYYDAENANGADAVNQDISIMRSGDALAEAYDTYYSAEATLAHVGWRDSDGDGVFDLADVPLDLQGSGYFDPETSTYRFVGTASAVPLQNRNSSGPQSDITLNRISRLEYRLIDGATVGDWTMAVDPDQQVVEFDTTELITDPFDEIQWRVIDAATGVTSPIVTGTPLIPAFSASNATGVSFLDENQNGQRDFEEKPLGKTTVIITRSDGSPLFGSQVDASLFSDGAIESSAGATLTADGDATNGDVGVGDLASNPPGKGFQWWDPSNQVWEDRWNADVAFEAAFDQPVGEVSIDAVSFDSPGFLRVEAYDSDNNFLRRVTSPAIELGSISTLTIEDPAGQIARIRAYGHAMSDVGLVNLRAGFQDQVVTDAGGAFRFENLPDGSYAVELIPENIIHAYSANPVSVEVVGGVSTLISAAAQRVDSFRHNADSPFDTNRDQNISSRDALVVINDLDRNQSRRLAPNETEGFEVDVNNDGFVSAVDALMVINHLARRQDGASGELIAGGAMSDAWVSSSIAAVDVSESGAAPVAAAPNGEAVAKIAVFSPSEPIRACWVDHAIASLESAESERSELLEPFLQSLI